MGLFSSKSSSSTSTSTENNLFDQRQVNDAGGGIAGTGNVRSSYDLSFIDAADYSNRSITDASVRTDDDLTFVDSSNRSTTVVNAVDPGTVAAGERMLRLNNELASAAIDTTSETANMLGGMAIQYGARIGESVSDLYARSGANTAQAWSATLNASERLMAGILDGAANTTRQAAQVASNAITAFQPTENKQADTQQKLGMLAAAAVAAFVLLRK